MPFGGVGMGEMILIFLVVLLLFGAKPPAGDRVIAG